MIEQNFIEKRTLPLALNFESLQQKGLDYIQEHSSKAWTNLNPSDPGITILEQLCFAFTELGYCNDFPMRDILTNREEILVLKNQFFLPEDILTTTPITTSDYIKYLIDRVEGVKNATVQALKTTLPQVKGAYAFDILWSDYFLKEIIFKEFSGDLVNPTCESAFFTLNYVRNLGEYFLTPIPLQPKSYQLSGTIEIDPRCELDEVLKKIQYQVNNYIFPDVVQTGYDHLKEKHVKTNTIFNGPILNNGWIPDKSMQSKNDVVKDFEIMKQIELLPEVVSVSTLSFWPEDENKYEICCKDDEILFLDIISSFNDGKFIVKSDGVQKNQQVKTQQISDLIKMEQPENQTESVAAVNMAPPPPTGKYRDIEDYYSIQNTFPQSYGLEMNSGLGNETPFQKAQVQQLRGYLTLYDQALINQFAQLANLSKLFSFKNSITGTPYDRSEYYSRQSSQEKANPKYPAPFEYFSPTYYYQSLYELRREDDMSTDVQKLLKNYDAHRFSLKVKTSRELDDIAWKGYKESPYNSYIWGLMIYMENEDVNLNRRNDILNHLLARHGVSPLVINTIVNNPVYTGNLEKDRVIIKSIYLQNFQTLSYNRSKAYNYLAADIVTPTLERKYELLLKELQAINFPKHKKHKKHKEHKEYIEPKMAAEVQLLLNGFTHASQNNFVFDVDRVDQREKVTALDIINFATVHLKMNLLFGLNEYYQNNIVSYPEDTKGMKPVLYEQKKNLLWMMTRQKGLLFIETNLLINNAGFKLVEGDNFQINPPSDPNVELSYQDLIMAFQNVSKDTPRTNIQGVWGVDKEQTLSGDLLKNTFILVFPLFLKSDEFKARVDFFLQDELPPQMSYTYLFVDDEQLQNLIPIYCDWHNSLIYKNSDSELLGKLVPEEPKTYAWNLLQALEDIDPNPLASDE